MICREKLWNFTAYRERIGGAYKFIKYDFRHLPFRYFVVACFEIITTTRRRDSLVSFITEPFIFIFVCCEIIYHNFI